MFYDFQIEYTREYAIIRDYWEKTNEYEGIRFILSDTKTGEIVTKFVLLEDIGTDSEWKKMKGSKQADYVKMIFQEGKENKVTEDVGKVKKKAMFDKEIKVDVKQYTYTLKKPN